MWLLFEEAVPAALARKVGSYILTETMERRPDIGFDSYDRFFPNQDTLPHGGFGNLIALPLQKHRRGDGNSVFLDDQGVPHRDQWAFLSTVGRIGRAQLEAVARDAERRGRILGVSLPRRRTTNQHRGRRHHLAAGRTRRLPGASSFNRTDSRKRDLRCQGRFGSGSSKPLLRVAAFQNPEFYKAQAMRLPTYDKPRIIACAEEHSHHIGLPRGCLEDVRHID